jgi:hypothetical protein
MHPLFFVRNSTWTAGFKKSENRPSQRHLRLTTVPTDFPVGTFHLFKFSGESVQRALRRNN